jgi:hypothetical protein
MKKFTNRNQGFTTYFTIIAIIAMLSYSLQSYSANKYARGGNWNSQSTWFSAASGGNEVPVPTANDAVIFVGGVTVTVTETAVCASISYFSTYATASTLIINDGVTLTTGAITFKVPGSAGTTLIDVGNGSLICTGISLAATSLSGKYCELKLNNGTVTVTGNLASGGINSKLTCTGTGTVNVSGTFLATNKATFTCGSGTINLNGTTQTIGSANVNYTFNNLTLSGSGIKTFPSIYNGINNVINGILTFQGTATCIITNDDMFTYGPNATLKYNRVGVTSPAVGVEWISPFTPTGGVIISGNSEIKLSSAKILSTGVPLTIEGGVTLKTQDNTISLGGNFVKNGYFTTGASSIALIGTADQSIGEINTLGNILMNKTGGTATMTGPFSVGQLIINGSGGSFNLGNFNHTVSQDWTLTEGTVYGGSSTLAVYGNFTKSSGTFVPGTSTISWKNPFSDISVIDYYSISLANISSSTSSYSTTKNISISGTLDLFAGNPTATAALLDMGSHTLLLSSTAQVTGLGDISGIVERQSFAANTVYSFSNPYTTISLSSGGTMPTSIKIKTTIGVAPTNKSDAVLRKYDIIQTGGSNVNLNLNLHYLSSELNANNEKALMVWDYEIDNGNETNFVELGKSTFDYDSKFIELTNLDIASFPSAFNEKGYILAKSASPTYIWIGTFVNNNTDWNEALNWDPTGVPGLTSNVIIPDGAPAYPVVDDINVKSITIEPNDAVFDGSTYDITVNGGVGAWSDPGGKFICGEKKVTFTNADASINGLSKFYDIHIDDAAKATIDNNSHIQITHAVTRTGTGLIDASTTQNTIEYLNEVGSVTLPSFVSNYSSLIINGVHVLPAIALTMEADFTLTGNAANTANEQITTKGNFTIAAGSEFITNENKLVFGGDFINAGTFTNAASDIELSYTTEEQFIDPFETTGEVSMTKTNGTVYFNDAIITGNLLINGDGGIMDLGTNNIDVSGDIILTEGSLLGNGSNINLNAVGSDWTGDGSLFDYGSSVVNFMADGAQEISATDAQFYSLNFLGTGTKTIAAPTMVYADLVAGGEEVVTNSSDVSVLGTMTVETGSEFTAGISESSVNHYVLGDFINLGTYYATDASKLTLESMLINEGSFVSMNNSTLSMSSTIGDQEIASTTDLDLYNLIQSNEAGKLIISTENINIENQLTLTIGNIVTTESTIINMNDASTVSPVSGSLNCYVEGPMTKSGTAAFVFPIGTSEHWAPIGIGAATASTSFFAEYHDFAHADCYNYTGDLTKISLVEYWDLNRIAGSGNATVTLYWKDTAYSKIKSPADLIIGHYNGSSWENLTNSIDFIDDNSHLFGNIFSTVAVTDFSPFTFGTRDNVSNPLPVEIISFEANCQDNGVLVNWTTASEYNNNFYTLERSFDNDNWEIVTKMDGAGKSNTTKKYNFTDNNATEAYYYRLKQTDYDGSFTFTQSIFVSCNDENKFFNNLSLFPNPTTDVLNIQDAPIGSEYQLYNSLGNRIYVGQIENQSTLINLSNQSSGIYFLVIKFNNTVIQRKFIKE